MLRVLADGFSYLVGALALVGAAWTAWRDGDGRRRLVLGWAATLLVAPLVFFGGSRFHLPALPIIAVFAALAIERVRARAGQPTSATSRPIRSSSAPR